MTDRDDSNLEIENEEEGGGDEILIEDEVENEEDEQDEDDFEDPLEIESYIGVNELRDDLFQDVPKQVMLENLYTFSPDVAADVKVWILVQLRDGRTEDEIWENHPNLARTREAYHYALLFLNLFPDGQIFDDPRKQFDLEAMAAAFPQYTGRMLVKSVIKKRLEIPESQIVLNEERAKGEPNVF